MENTLKIVGISLRIFAFVYYSILMLYLGGGIIYFFVALLMPNIRIPAVSDTVWRVTLLVVAGMGLALVISGCLLADRKVRSILKALWRLIAKPFIAVNVAFMVFVFSFLLPQIVIDRIYTALHLSFIPHRILDIFAFFFWLLAAFLAMWVFVWFDPLEQKMRLFPSTLEKALWRAKKKEVNRQILASLFGSYDSENRRDNPGVPQG